MHVLFCNWRDTRNPEGGGSERYVERMAEGLVEQGHGVTIACAKYAGAPMDETVNGVRFVRRGSKMDIYLRTFLALILGRYGPIDVVVDVQNGLPFFTRLATRRPVIMLVHHVHREQWPVVYPGIVGRFGWWVESWLSPRLYRHSQYVAVSQSTRAELVELGVDADSISVIHNGNDPAPVVKSSRSSSPRMSVLGRLVPHKQVEHAIDAVARLSPTHPDLVLDVVGAGWWDAELRTYAHQLGVADRIIFHGFVDDLSKHEVLAQSWVMALPSLKEGWGIVVGEAGTHSTPTVAYATAGGTNESIDHQISGYLAQDEDEFVTAIGDILDDKPRRDQLGQGALTKSHAYTWLAAQTEFVNLVARAGTQPSSVT